MTIPSGLDMFEDIEVWIVVDDYVSYSINDKELTLTFKENLDVKEIIVNEQTYILQNQKLVLPNHSQYNQLMIYDQYGHENPYNVAHLKSTSSFNDEKLKLALIEQDVDLDKDGMITEFEANQVKVLDL